MAWVAYGETLNGIAFVRTLQPPNAALPRSTSTSIAC